MNKLTKPMLGFIGAGIIVILIFGLCVWAVFKVEEGLQTAVKADDGALEKFVARFVASESGKVVLACGLTVGAIALLAQIARMLGLR